jgi:VanZ family protein
MVETEEVSPPAPFGISPPAAKKIWWVLVVLWCGLIFYMSSQPADESSRLSLFIAEALDRLLRQIFGPHAAAVSEEVVRKCAHLMEYLALGCLLFMAFVDRAYPVRAVLPVFTFGVLFAVSDELHQLFVPGRAMRLVDILIDTAGIALAVFIMRGTTKPRKPDALVGPPGNHGKP